MTVEIAWRAIIFRSENEQENIQFFKKTNHPWNAFVSVEGTIFSENERASTPSFDVFSTLH